MRGYHTCDSQTAWFVFSAQDKDKKKKESIFDLSKYIDKPIRVKFQGGREGRWISHDNKLTVKQRCGICCPYVPLMETLHRVFVSSSASGVLKGFDPLLNLVLDGTIEYMRGKCAL